MGQPVKLSDALVMDARIAGEAMQRSIAGQVEFWASLGKQMEMILTGGQIAKLIQRTEMADLLARLDDVNSPDGRARLQAYLKTHKFPRYWAHPEQARLFIREEADGAKSVGRFEGREWIEIDVLAGDAEPVGGE
jgi:hypothetical protein